MWFVWDSGLVSYMSCSFMVHLQSALMMHSPHWSFGWMTRDSPDSP